MIYFDLETDAIDDKNPALVTHIHCIAIKEGNAPTQLFHGDNLKDAYTIIESANAVCGHNILAFDLPVLRRLAKVVPSGKTVDTFTLSCLLNADRNGGHSLKAWGLRTGTYKGEYSDWSKYTDEMGEYCKQDVEATAATYAMLLKEMQQHPKGVEGWAVSARLEHKIAEITEQQRFDGVYFDVDKARELLTYIDARMYEIEELVEPKLPTRDAKKSEIGKLTPPKKQFKKDGTPSALCEKFFDEVIGESGNYVGVLDGKEYQLPYHEPVDADFKMTLGNQDDLKNWLLTIGWKPTIWNFKKKDGKFVRENGKLVKTSPKFQENGKVCENLSNVAFDHIKEVVEWLSLRHRRSLVSGLIDNLRSDGRLGADAVPCGTPTGRYRHRIVVNIPKADPSVTLGSECRSLFCAPEGKVLVGSDASGLELRMLAHYMNDPEFTHELLQGDIHTVMWKVCEDLIPSRSVTKNCEYAMIYGASDGKIGETAGHSGANSVSVGREIKSRWMSRFPALGHLIESVTKAAERGYLIGIDGRLIQVRQSHKALNCLLQSAGSIVVKSATAYGNAKLGKYGAIQVGHWHDEWLVECDPSVASDVEKLLDEGIKWTEELFNIKCPLSCDASTGKTWGDVH